jgi:SIR2-like domain
MQFLPNGPDIPDALLQAHEDGRVVFFCGAGISYPAGLPGFEGLVRELYSHVGERQDAIEWESFEAKQFDRTIGHFENRIQGGKRNVRRHLKTILSPDLTRRRALTSHLALLTLARQRDGVLRLVTTNFDTLFEAAISHYQLPPYPVHPDPPSRNLWEGLVYLHGRLPEQSSVEDLDRLILSDADFGKAYLLEAWAARFVAALFRDYVVCFVGYSIDDPVLRYMTAAHATKVSALDMYAFASFEGSEDREKQSSAWRAKNVTPILYRDEKYHRNLHRTLQIWASIHRDGVKGRERIVSRLAMRDHGSSTPENDFVGRMLWALSHESGLPAKRFAEFNPVPPIEWLEAFSEDRYQHGDLNRFNVPTRSEADDKLRFSLIRRPAPYKLSPWMSLVTISSDTQLDAVMLQIARWLMRHLNDPVLIIWLAQHGGQLHDRLSWFIDDRLNELARLEREGNTVEINDIRTNASNAIPGPLMQTLWRLLLTGRIKSQWRDTDLYRWKDRLKRAGLTATMRLELRELLSPKVTLKKPFRWGAGEESTDEPTRIKQLVDWELVLASDHVHSALRDLDDELWRTALPALLDDFQQLLRDALDLLQELGEADERSDRSHWDLPSISPHRQNRGFRDWATLIELLRDAWLAMLINDPKRARRVALTWFDQPYPTFKRLALFAASHDGCIVPELWVEWLVVDNSWWLWTGDTRRETMRLLVLQGGKLAPSVHAKLETAILAGPPRQMYKDDLEPARWQELVDHSIWLHLNKLREGCGQLSHAAIQRIDELTAANPEWQLASNESDEFSFWISGSGDPDYEVRRVNDSAPRKRRELVDWLKKPAPTWRSENEDTWRETCSTRFFHSYLALCDLAQEAIWPTERWRVALQAWSEEGRVLRSWQFAAPVVQSMPESVTLKNVHGITWWMEAASKSIERHEVILLNLSKRVLELPVEPGTGMLRNGAPINQPVTEAINHPIGHITQALLNLWFKREPVDNSSLPNDIEPYFKQLCDIGIEKFRHGRVVLASRLITFYRVDHIWTETHLLPLFDWTRNSVEAKAAWEGFLWSPRLYFPLLNAFKPQFLATALHYDELGEHRSQFAAIITHAALESDDGYSPEDFQTAIGDLPQDGLNEVAQALSRALESAGEQREDYLRNRVQPFWHLVWPKSRNLASNSIGESLALLCIAAGNEFPAAVFEVVDWLRPIEHPHYVVNKLHKSGLCRRFLDAALRMLNAILNDQPWPPSELGQCLDVIAQVMPNFTQDFRYKRLVEYARRRA